MSGSIDDALTEGDERSKKNADAVCGPWNLDRCLEIYQKWSVLYDKDFSEDRYRAPQFSAEAIAQLFPDGIRPEVQILDVAAGTGKVGRFLNALGFSRVHALDPSTDMLEILKQGNCYERIYQDTVGHHQTEIPDGTYDVTTMSGGFVEGHVPVTALDEMLRVTKRGGYVVVSMREEYLELVPDYRHLERHASSFEAEGQWKLISRERRPNYFFEKHGVVFTWKVL